MPSYSVSYVVPMFNEEKYISVCLDSLVKLKLGNDQIIVVDNGSTDSSLDIVRRYAGVILVEKPGATVASVRNAGASLATGDVLAFIDADCVLADDWRIQVMDTLELQKVSATGSKVGLPVKASWVEKAWCSQRTNSAGATGYINSGNFIVWRSVFVGVGGFDEALITGEDSEFCWRLRRSGHVVFENPEIKVRHLGNPKNLWSFYRQQRWHGLGMFGTFKISKFDKPVIMTLVFIFCNLLAVALLVGFSNTLMVYSLVVLMLLIFLVPVLTSAYRCLQYKNFKFFFQLILLYLFYYFARANAIFQIIYSRFARNYSKVRAK